VYRDSDDSGHDDDDGEDNNNDDNDDSDDDKPVSSNVLDTAEERGSEGWWKRSRQYLQCIVIHETFA
jgi:hypothetical protein